MQKNKAKQRGIEKERIQRKLWYYYCYYCQHRCMRSGKGFSQTPLHPVFESQPDLSYGVSWLFLVPVGVSLIPAKLTGKREDIGWGNPP